MGLSSLVKTIKKENKEKNKPIEQKFVDVIDKFIVEKALESEPSSRLAFHPSQYYKCERQTYYYLKQVQVSKKVYPRSERKLQVGTKLHHWIQNDILIPLGNSEHSINILKAEDMPHYGKKGLTFIQEHGASPLELKFIDESYTEIFPISGMVDGAFEFMGFPMLFEFKTINPSDFEYLIEPLPDHIKQGAIYALCTGLRKIMFLYLGKGIEEFKPFCVNYNDEQLDWVVKKLTTIENYILNNVLPDKEEGIVCRFCAYSKYCAENFAA